MPFFVPVPPTILSSATPLRLKRMLKRSYCWLFLMGVCRSLTRINPVVFYTNCANERSTESYLKIIKAIHKAKPVSYPSLWVEHRTVFQARYQTLLSFSFYRLRFRGYWIYVISITMGVPEVGVRGSCLTPPKFWKAPFDSPKFWKKKKQKNDIYICI